MLLKMNAESVDESHLGTPEKLVIMISQKSFEMSFVEYTLKIKIALSILRQLIT